MRTKLSDRYLINVKPVAGQRFEVWDTLIPGFGVRVGGGKKSFVMMLRIGGKLRRITLGEYPALSLAEARLKVSEAHDAAERGEDPADATPREVAPRHGKTIGDLVPEFIEKHCKKKNRDWRKQQSIFELDVLPHWRNRLATSIKRRDVIDLLDKAEARTSSVTANRVRAHLSRFFNWLIERDTPGIEVNPVARVKPPGEERRRQRVLSDDELRVMWEAANAEGFPFGTVAQLLAVTLQRHDEVGAMRWPDIDLDKAVWIIPAEQSKNGVPNAVPLPPLAVRVLRDAPVFDPGGHVFPAANGSGKPASGYSKAKRRLDDAMAAKFAEQRKGEIPHYHIDGEERGVRKTYDVYDYFDEKREALERWARHLESVIGGTNENVIPLRVAG